MKTKNEVSIRILNFVKQNGGFYEVAEKIGRNAQIFYNYANRGSMPNFELLLKIKEKYPDLDLNWVATGVETNTVKEIELVKRLDEALETMSIFKRVALGKYRGISLRQSDGFSLTKFKRSDVSFATPKM